MNYVVILSTTVIVKCSDAVKHGVATWPGMDKDRKCQQIQELFLKIQARCYRGLGIHMYVTVECCNDIDHQKVIYNYNI